MTYTVKDATATNDDVDKFIWVIAQLRPTAGVPTRKRSTISPYPVKTAVVGENSLPKFSPTAHTRRVAEEVGGANVGGAR